MIQGLQVEKRGENKPCGRLKCVLVTGNTKPLPASGKRLRQNPDGQGFKRGAFFAPCAEKFDSSLDGPDRWSG